MAAFIQLQKQHQWKWQLTYIKNVVGGVFGMEIIDEVIIEGHMLHPDKAETIIAEGLEKVKEIAKKLSPVLYNNEVNKKKGAWLSKHLSFLSLLIEVSINMF